MFLRALIAFLVFPGFVCFVSPLVLAFFDLWKGQPQFLGLCIVLLGLFELSWCARDLYIHGKGTLAPWAPPKNLVVIGLYRFVRNPMYVSMVTIVVGWAIFFASPILGLYAVSLVVSFHLRVIRQEEPLLAKEFGQSWLDYKSRVARWFPRLHNK